MYNPYNYEISVWYDDEDNTFNISTDKWSMDYFDPINKRLCFNGDGFNSEEFDQIMKIRDKGGNNLVNIQQRDGEITLCYSYFIRDRLVNQPFCPCFFSPSH